MKVNIKPKTLKFVVAGAGLLGAALRTLLYATGIDGRNLLVENHPAGIALWCLAAAVAALLLISCRRITGSSAYLDAYPVSFAAFAGCLAAAAAMVITQLGAFGNFETVLDIFIWALGLAAALCLACIGVCRLIRAKPHFLLHVVVCLYFTFRLVSRYRLWSSDPQAQNYIFYLMAYLLLMLTAYQYAAFDAAMGNHRALWLCSLGACFLCCVCTSNSPEPLLMACCALWSFTGLTNLTVRKRRTRPALNMDGGETQGS